MRKNGGGNSVNYLKKWLWGAPEAAAGGKVKPVEK